MNRILLSACAVLILVSCVGYVSSGTMQDYRCQDGVQGCNDHGGACQDGTGTDPMGHITFGHCDNGNWYSAFKQTSYLAQGCVYYAPLRCDSSIKVVCSTSFYQSSDCSDPESVVCTAIVNGTQCKTLSPP
jgi:hypothetical protein